MVKRILNFNSCPPINFESYASGSKEASAKWAAREGRSLLSMEHNRHRLRYNVSQGCDSRTSFGRVSDEFRTKLYLLQALNTTLTGQRVFRNHQSGNHGSLLVLTPISLRTKYLHFLLGIATLKLTSDEVPGELGPISIRSEALSLLRKLGNNALSADCSAST